MAYVTVTDADAGPLSIPMSPLSVVRGSVVIEGEGAGVTPVGVTLTAVPADFDRAPINMPAPRAQAGPDGAFQFTDVTGPVRIALANARPGWWLKSVMVNGVNAADDPVTFNRDSGPMTGVLAVVSTRGAAVAGRLTNADRQTTPDYAAILFSTDRTRWYDQSPYVATSRSDQTGAFSISGLPPGDYWAVAVDAALGGSDERRNPDVLTGLTSSARRISLDEGQRMDVELHLAPTP
jgi:hypothetical protein